MLRRLPSNDQTILAASPCHAVVHRRAVPCAACRCRSEEAQQPTPDGGWSNKGQAPPLGRASRGPECRTMPFYAACFVASEAMYSRRSAFEVITFISCQS